MITPLFCLKVKLRDLLQWFSCLQMIVNMSHAAIVNPMANLGSASLAGMSNGSLPEYQMPALSAAPQMPTLKPAPSMNNSNPGTPVSSIQTPVTSKSAKKDDKNVKYDADGKRIKKGELDPATMVHVPGGMLCMAH